MLSPKKVATAAANLFAVSESAEDVQQGKKQRLRLKESVELHPLPPTTESVERSEVIQSQGTAGAPTYEIVSDVDLSSLPTTEKMCPKPDVDDDRASLEHSGCYEGADIVCAPSTSKSTVIGVVKPHVHSSNNPTQPSELERSSDYVNEEFHNFRISPLSKLSTSVEANEPTETPDYYNIVSEGARQSSGYIDITGPISHHPEPRVVTKEEHFYESLQL